MGMDVAVGVATRGVECVRYVISPYSSVDSEMVTTAVYTLCVSWDASAPAARDSGVFSGTGAGGGLKGRYFPERMWRGKLMAASSGALSRCCTSFRLASAVIAARNSSFSSLFVCSCCGDEILSCLRFPVIISRFSTVCDKVEITSEGLLFAFVRCVKMLANASSLIAFGKLLVREMGR